MKRDLSLLRVLSPRDCVNRFQVLVHADFDTIRRIVAMPIFYSGDQKGSGPDYTEIYSQRSPLAASKV